MCTSTNVRPTAHRGFTLTELLVVGTVVALLVAIVGPSLEASRRHARLNVCLDRLRSIMAAGMLYSEDDPQRLAIPVHPAFYAQNTNDPVVYGAYEWGGKSGIGGPGFCEGDPADPLTSRFGTKCGFGPATRPLNNVLYPHGFRDNLTPVFDDAGALLDTQLDLKVYQCPADDGPPEAAHCPDWLANPGRTSYDHFGTSYAANIFMTASTSGGFMDSNSPYLRPLERVPDPARTYFFEENIGRWMWAAREDPCDFLAGVELGASKSVRGWHGKDWMYNHGYGDGHAEYQKIYIDGTTDALGFANHYRSEEVFDDSGDQSFNRCIIIRGDGWQKDTHPDESIPTDLYHAGEGRPSYEGCVGG